jgi:hypothetical protein
VKRGWLDVIPDDVGHSLLDGKHCDAEFNLLAGALGMVSNPALDLTVTG